jgi:hypothetical protein
VDLLLSALLGVFCYVCPDVWGEGEQLTLADSDRSLQRALVHFFYDLLVCFLLARAREWRRGWLRKNRGWIWVHKLYAFLGRACNWFGKGGGRLGVGDGILREVEALLGYLSPV